MRHVREELVQVAAVAVAIVEQIDKGSADVHRAERSSNTATGGWADLYTEVVLADVLMERIKQHDKWGVQLHPLSVWLLILTEEVGEAAKAVLEL